MTLFIPFIYNLKKFKDNAFLTTRQKNKKEEEDKGFQATSNWILFNSDVTCSPPRWYGWLLQGEGGKKWQSPPRRSYLKRLEDSALSKGAQRNSGMEGTSLSLMMRKRGGEKQKKGRGPRCGPKSQSNSTLQANWDLWKCQWIFISRALSWVSTDCAPHSQAPCQHMPAGSEQAPSSRVSPHTVKALNYFIKKNDNSLGGGVKRSELSLCRLPLIQQREGNIN